jgi:cytoskeleton protein RodZ
MSDRIQDDAMLREQNLSSFGEKLKSTRETMGISMQEAGSRLHLSPRFIAMMENEDLLQSTLPPIYLRGYLRSYTRLLNISEAELAQVLEKLNPKPPMIQDPVPVSSMESLSISFPLENNPYYARIATILISLVLLTSITGWWYLHANNNNAPTTLVALDQPLANPVPLESANAVVSNSASLNISNNPLLQSAAKNPEVAPAKVTEVGTHLNEKQSLALASSAGVASPPAPTVSKHDVKPNDIEEESTDEQE